MEGPEVEGKFLVKSKKVLSPGTFVNFRSIRLKLMTFWAKFNPRHVNLPNAISVLRALMSLPLPFFILSDSKILYCLIFFLFTAASITDYLDGWIARKQGSESSLGKILDPTSDKVLILLPLAAFSYLGHFSPWWLVPIFIREIFVTFCRIGWLLEGKAAGAEKLGKIKLVFQVIVVGVAYLEFMTHKFDTLSQWQTIAHYVTLAVLVIVNLLTLISGWTFLRSNRALFLTPAFAKFVSACGVGLLPGVTGTWGSLLALLFIPFLAWNSYLYWGMFVFILWAGYWAVNRLDLSREKDPKYVVVDEVLGMFVTYIGVKLSATNLIAGFFLFRIFDILKPPPCRQLEKIPGFWGITLDDIGAGIYACLVLHLFFHA